MEHEQAKSWEDPTTKYTQTSIKSWDEFLLTFLESVASAMMASQPLKVATWKSEMYAFGTSSKVMGLFSHLVLFSARHPSTSGTISAETGFFVIRSTHFRKAGRRVSRSDCMIYPNGQSKEEYSISRQFRNSNGMFK